MKSGNSLLAIMGSLLMSVGPLSSSAGETNTWSCRFGRGAWQTGDWFFVERRDMPSNPEWIQKDDCVENDGRHTSMLLKKKFAGDVTLRATMAFADRMAPSIVIATGVGKTPDGKTVYNEHLEVVLFDEGINVWTLHTVDNRSIWKLTAFCRFKLTGNTAYKLQVTKKGKELAITVDNHTFGYSEESLPDDFYVGITAAEGVNRVFDFAVAQATR